MQDERKLEQMLEDLLQIDDESWGLYAFSRELLNRKIAEEEKKEMIEKAIECGKKYARRMKKQYGTTDIMELADKLKLAVSLRENSMVGKRVLFALYTPSNQIEIMKEPIDKAACLISNEASVLVELFGQNDIMNTILGHEVFHFIEDQFEQEIYTRTKKILLWKFIGFKNYSTIRTLSEIAAMAFTKELNGLNFSPFLLDILLYYSYDSCSAEKIYQDVLEISSGRCRKTVEGG